MTDIREALEREMVIGDLLNVDMLKEVIEVEQKASLWVDGDHGTMTPYVCDCSFGDGLHLMTVSTINQRPNYWVVRVDSGWRGTRWPYRLGDREDVRGEMIDDVLTAIEEECGYACNFLNEPCLNCGDECCRCDVDSWEAFPAIDEDCGCSWGEIRWQWLMKAIGYTPSIDRVKELMG